MAGAPQTVGHNGPTQPAGTGLFAGGLTAWAVGMAGGLVIGLIAGLSLGLLIDSTGRSDATAQLELPALPGPQDLAPRPWWMVWKRM